MTNPTSLKKRSNKPYDDTLKKQDPISFGAWQSDSNKTTNKSISGCYYIEIKAQGCNIRCDCLSIVWNICRININNCVWISGCDLKLITILHKACPERTTGTTACKVRAPLVNIYNNVVCRGEPSALCHTSANLSLFICLATIDEFIFFYPPGFLRDCLDPTFAFA